MMKLAAELEARARVLIVEDDSAARTTLQAIVSEFYEVEVVEDAEQAERALMRSDIQVLITDYEMPGRSGVDLITMVFERYPMIVPILLTGHTTKREVRQADKDRNVFAVLAKPYEPEALLRSLRLAVATAQARALQVKVPSSKSRP